MKYYNKTSCILLIAFTAGIISGWFYGEARVNNFLKGKISISDFFFQPSKNMFDTYILLNSENELHRLEGYYAYRGIGLRDPDFLFKRYSIDESVLLRKTIIWIARDLDGNIALDFYKKLYEISPDTLKKYLQGEISRYELIELKKE